MNTLIAILLVLTESPSIDDLIEGLNTSSNARIRKDTMGPAERAYHTAGLPFGQTARAFLIWVRFQQQTTAN